MSDIIFSKLHLEFPNQSERMTNQFRFMNIKLDKDLEFIKKRNQVLKKKKKNSRSIVILENSFSSWRINKTQSKGVPLSSTIEKK